MNQSTAHHDDWRWRHDDDACMHKVAASTCLRKDLLEESIEGVPVIKLALFLQFLRPSSTAIRIKDPCTRCTMLKKPKRRRWMDLPLPARRMAHRDLRLDLVPVLWRLGVRRGGLGRGGRAGRAVVRSGHHVALLQGALCGEGAQRSEAAGE